MSQTEASEEHVFQFDTLLSPEFTKAPHPYYKHMRDTNPVLRTPSMYGDGGGMVWVAKHNDIDEALRCPEVYSSKFNRDMDPLVPINYDPPEHLRYRRLLDPLFGPKEMKQLEGEITRRANEFIDAFIGRGECDYAEEYAVPLPCSVFLQIMGLPLEDLPHFLRLKELMLRGSGGGVPRDQDIPRQQAREEATERFSKLIVERRRDPQDDVLSKIIHADVEGRPLSEEELLGVCHLMLIAGLDTVTDSLTCFYAFLGRSPEHRRRLVEDPDIIPQAVEEMLRFESPVPFVPRVAQDAATLSGCPIDKGDTVMLLLGSANSDERATDGADHIDFDRAGIRHLAFGGGIHRCLGSHLARLELRVSLREWHKRIPEYHIPDDVELQWSTLLRQVEHLPLVFDRVVG